MNAAQPDPFEAAVAHCRAAYGAFLELEKRTHAALYKALGGVYTLWNQIQTDNRFRARFDQLLASRNKRQKDNPVLFLVEYSLLPHLLKFGSGNKPDED
jgi:hypothetical protein